MRADHVCLGLGKWAVAGVKSCFHIFSDIPYFFVFAVWANFSFHFNPPSLRFICPYIEQSICHNIIILIFILLSYHFHNLRHLLATLAKRNKVKKWWKLLKSNQIVKQYALASMRNNKQIKIDIMQVRNAKMGHFHQLAKSG